MNLSDEPELCSIDTVDWPRDGRMLMNEVAGLLTMALRTSVERTRNHGQEAYTISRMALVDKDRIDDRVWIEIYRRRLQAVPARNRPQCTAPERAFIMRAAAEKHWSAKDIAHFAVIDSSSARKWRREWTENPGSTLFTGVTAWNSYDDALKDLVHRIQTLFPGQEIGARTIANHILRATIAISRASVRRYLQEPPPTRTEPDEPIVPKAPPKAPADSSASSTTETFHVLKPDRVNHVWHADFTQIQVLWMTFWVTSIMDGFSRKLLALKVSLATPTTNSVFDVFKSAAALFGAPRFAITDRGSQFRESFAKLLRDLHVDVIHGPVERPQFNGKCERFFRTMKLWQRIARYDWPLDLAFIQRRLDDFRNWYNENRVHQGVNGMTPDEAWSGIPRMKPVRYFARDNLDPVFSVQRINHNDDPYLPIFDIRVISKKPA